MLKMYDRVRAIKSLPAEGRTPLKRGSEGTIIDIYRTGKAIGYHIEFTDERGHTEALLMLSDTDFELIEEKFKPTS